MHPSACKATAPSSLPPLMIPLLPALPRLGQPCPRLGEDGAVTAGHRPAIPYADKVDSKEERRDSCSATEEEEGWRALAKELEMPRGAFSYVGWWTRPGRKVGTGFPLCKHGTSSRQEALREVSNSLPPLSFSVVGDVYLNLNTRAAAILLTAIIAIRVLRPQATQEEGRQVDFPGLHS
ncbi:hypothetical protein V8E54_014598 [Elaphomyces granulatus]